MGESSPAAVPAAVGSQPSLPVRASNGTPALNGSAKFKCADQYLGQGRPMKIIVVGAGLSGIAAVKIFKDTFTDGSVELVIYEKNSDVTGTWLENRYPGCACDVPAHAYTFSWEGNPRWSRAYVGSPELYEYFKGRAVAYGVDKFVKLNSRVKEAVWNESEGKWKVQIEDVTSGTTFSDEAEVLINAAGFLNKWKMPDIPGLESFRGKLIHSAQWDEAYSLDDKVVGIIGTGSSAIQIIPQIQLKVKHLTSFIRSSTWITPEFAAEFAPEGRTAFFSERQKDEWAQDKDKFLEYRKKVESTMNKFFDMQFKDSTLQKDAYENFRKTMRERLSRKPELAELMIPTFGVGCRRVTPGHGYLEALTEDNVTVRSDGIAAITEDGVRMNKGDTIKLDVLICATGFDTSFRPPFPLIGREGRDLRDEWAEEPRSYCSIAALNMPNYFIISGPNFPLANGCLLPCLETNIQYAFTAVQKLRYDSIKAVVPKPQAVDDFQEFKDALMEDLVWTDHCVSWYKNGKAEGKVWGPWPGSSLSYLELMARPRWEDWDFTYLRPNRFSFLGRGKTERECCGGDLAYYLTEPGAAKTA
ncbi:hypothetical protein AYO21_08218 [Fonsecaea monophora]|uniref:Uncharacterized protein n=1 Tax=Fonsecaea monophora TaxID=254056 RepID=A0A177F291_9EURO|nr:hypothetical protein AYO21_08218 [Fonsecaea monophora]OAG37610.1 hypothetical protein AYO21_08218 [Fonsecaea monophora]